MTYSTVSDFIYETKQQFGSDNITKVSLTTVNEAFKILTLLVKSPYTSTLVEVYMHDDYSYIRNIANIENSVIEITRIVNKINNSLEKLGLSK